MKQRLVRILVYEGTPEWLQATLAARAVKGSFSCLVGVIKEALVGDFLEEVTERIVEPEVTISAPQWRDVSQGCGGHNGEYDWQCIKCGHIEWFSAYGNPNKKGTGCPKCSP